MTARAVLERRIASALDASPSRIPVILGGCGTGRTHLLGGLRDRLGRTACQYINIERTATTPERFLRALTAASPFHRSADREPPNARESFDATLAFFDQARVGGSGPATFLLDEALEFRTFESFPGLRHILRDLLDGLAASANRFVLTTRYVARAHRLLRDATPRFEVIHVTPLSAGDVRGMLPEVLTRSSLGDDGETDSLVRAIQVLGDGRPQYVRAIAEAMASMADRHGGTDPVSALAALVAPEGRLCQQCGFCYELRLHRARGYGALKAILEILAQEEPLTLTEISQRLHRTPGSTKDYLSWLEDVDLVASRQKRYSFNDPMLRLWVRLHCRPSPPSDEEISREVHGYALARLPQPEPALAMAATGDGAGSLRPDEDRGKAVGIIEID